MSPLLNISLGSGFVEHLKQPDIFPLVEVKGLDEVKKIRSFSLNWFPYHLKSSLQNLPFSYKDKKLSHLRYPTWREHALRPVFITEAGGILTEREEDPGEIVAGGEDGGAVVEHQVGGPATRTDPAAVQCSIGTQYGLDLQYCIFV